MWKRDQQENSGAPSDVRQSPIQPAVPAATATSPPVTASTPVAHNPGRSFLIKGDISASEDLVLHGRVDGNVSLPDHVLTIGPQAEVSAEIVARGLIVEGSVDGNVAAAERFEIKPGGRMKGDVTCPNVVMSEGAEFTGRVDMRRRFGKTDGPPVDGERRREPPPA
jgi:cytoskeletal protein CcmA (bactofilin family)